MIIKRRCIPSASTLFFTGYTFLISGFRLSVIFELRRKTVTQNMVQSLCQFNLTFN